jgi:glycosyltransferase involved in cell wall biosynthesis
MKKNKLICLVLVVDDLGYGGTERQVVELANNLNPDRFSVHVCTLSDHIPLSDKLRNKNHKLHIIRKKNRFDLTVIPRLISLLKTLKPDIVHGYMFSAEIASRLAGRIAGIKCIIGSERNANRISVRKSNILAYKLTQPFVDFIIANSKAGAESHAKIYNRSPTYYRVVYNGVDTERFRPADGMSIRSKLGIPKECPVIGSFANFKKQKNHMMLFRAFKLVLESCPDTRLLLVGDKPLDLRRRLNGYMVQLEDIIDDLNIRHQCMFLGHRPDVEHIYPACDITVLSSLHEGTPNVLLESMACCVPVIATNVCDNQYIIKEGEVGHLVGVGNETEMAYHMKTMLNNKILRKEMGQKARNWVKEKFSNIRLAQNMETVYREFLSKKHK